MQNKEKAAPEGTAKGENMALEQETVETPRITIKEIQRYVDEGWLIYDASTERQIREHGIKYIILANPNHPG